MIDLSLIAKVSQELRDMLGDDYDDDTFLDTLDGETDAVAIADWMIAKKLSDDAMAAALKSQEAEMKTRRERIEARSEAFRGRMLTLIEVMGVAKLERPRATISKLAGRQSVRITDEASIPTQLCKTTVTPDRAAIKSQLEAGQVVPGADLVRGDDTVSVRVK